MRPVRNYLSGYRDRGLPRIKKDEASFGICLENCIFNGTAPQTSLFNRQDDEYETYSCLQRRGGETGVSQ